MPRPKANTAAIRQALDGGATLEEAISAGFSANGTAALVASGAAGLPLGDRDETWSASDAEGTIAKWASSDGSGDPDTIDWGKYGQAFFWHDDSPGAKGDFKLGFAKNDNGLHAVWAGVTAVAAALQGSRGGVKGLSADDRDAIQGKVGAYYTAAAKKYDDDSIKPPWDSASVIGDERSQAAAAVEAMSDEEWEAWATLASTHDFRGDEGEECAICGKAHDDPIHYGHEDDASAMADAPPPAKGDDAKPAPQEAPPAGQGEDPDQPHSFKPADGDQSQCAVCGEGASEDVHNVAAAPADGEKPAPEKATSRHVTGITLASGKRLLGLFAVAGRDVIDLRDAMQVEAPVDGEAPAETPDVPVTGGARFKTLLALEDTATDDGRKIEPGALTWRELPLTLMAMIEEPEMGGHGGAQVAGRIDTITREGNEVIGTGVFDTGEYGAEIARLVSDKVLRGVSVDLAIKEYEERYGDMIPEEDQEDAGVDPFFGEPFLLIVKQAVIMGATVCPFPAFADANIEIMAGGQPILHVNRDGDVYVGMTLLGEFQEAEDPDASPGRGMIALFPEEAAAIDGGLPDEPHVTLFGDVGGDLDSVSAVVDEVAATCAALSGHLSGAAVIGGSTPGEGVEAADGGADAALIDVPGLSAMRAALAVALDAAGIGYATDHDFTPHIATGGGLEHALSLRGQPVTFGSITVIDADGRVREVPLTTGLTASAAGMIDGAPPSAWFDYPADVVPMDDLVPFTVTDDGRVYGHVALFNECHIGSPQGRCITAPHHYREQDGRCAVCGDRGSHGHSQSWYDYFHLGQVETADGELVNVGQVTLGTGHAPVGGGMTPKAAAAHYDNTGTATCDVRCYENALGIVVAGALRPDAPAARVRELRGAKISGDWRAIRGHHELVGLLAVNVPGFPIPRAQRGVEVGETGPRELALVAAGLVPDEPTDGTIEYRDHREEMRRMVRRERLRALLSRAGRMR